MVISEHMHGDMQTSGGPKTKFSWIYSYFFVFVLRFRFTSIVFKCKQQIKTCTVVWQINFFSVIILITSEINSRLRWNFHLVCHITDRFFKDLPKIAKWLKMNFEFSRFFFCSYPSFFLTSVSDKNTQLKNTVRVMSFRDTETRKKRNLPVY